jgi:hypothetical protein
MRRVAVLECEDAEKWRGATVAVGLAELVRPKNTCS